MAKGRVSIRRAFTAWRRLDGRYLLSPLLSRTTAQTQARMPQEVPVACTCIDRRDSSGSGRILHLNAPVRVLARCLSLPPFSDDPWNHCCPTDFIYCPTHNIPRALTPPLRNYHDFTFRRVGDAVDLFRQLFEVRRFMPSPNS